MSEVLGCLLAGMIIAYVICIIPAIVEARQEGRDWLEVLFEED